MKWTKKGHEFEEMARNLRDKKIYVYGAGDYGSRMSKTFSALEINFEFIDGNYEKQKQGFLGKKVISPVDIFKESKNVLIVLAAGEKTALEMKRILEKEGLVENQDYFSMDAFKQSVLPVYAWYIKNKMYMPSVGFLITTVCNLNCDACLNFTPYNKNQIHEEVDSLKESLSLYFKNIDIVDFFSYCGGEPLLYPYIDEILEHIGERYRDQIITLAIPTNCTIVPKDSTCELCAKYDFKFFIDDYSEFVPQSKNILQKIEEKFKAYNIQYEINRGDISYWIDLAPLVTDNYGMSEEELIDYKRRCAVPYRDLYRGKLYACNYSSYGIKAGLDRAEENDYYDFNMHEKKNNAVLMEFIMGYTEKGYLNFCKHCAGSLPINPYRKPVGKQLPRK